jgi:eukaryotic-like serine/threonine-protein kinase
LINPHEGQTPFLASGSRQPHLGERSPLIVVGYEGLKAREARIPPQGKARLKEAADRVVKLYEAWEKKDKAADWRAKLAGP